MLPDSMKGFAPTIHGIARSNAQVTIRQNGYIINQRYVPPGAFTINDLYPTAASGDLTVEVKESDGSINRYNVPYSAVPILQREGRLKYAATVAEYRSDSSQKEKVKFSQATLIWGLPHGFTLYGGTQLSSHYHALAIGSGANLGDWGAVSLDVTGLPVRWRIITPTGGNRCVSCMPNRLHSQEPIYSLWAIAIQLGLLRWMIPRGNG